MTLNKGNKFKSKSMERIAITGYP